jgi:peroxiredoxin
MMRLILLLSITLILSIAGCSTQPSSQPYVISNCEGIAEIGKAAPNFTWTDIDNIEHSLGEFKGKPIIIVTWDMACTICIKEVLPYINDNFDLYSKQGVVILSINNGDATKALSAFIDEKGYIFPVLIDREPNLTFRSHYGLKPGNPYLILIDKDNLVINKENPGNRATTDLLIKKLIGLN